MIHFCDSISEYLFGYDTVPFSVKMSASLYGGVTFVITVLVFVTVYFMGVLYPAIMLTSVAPNINGMVREQLANLTKFNLEELIQKQLVNTENNGITTAAAVNTIINNLPQLE